MSNGPPQRLDPEQIQPGQEVQVVNATRRTLVAQPCLLALTSWSRMRGLLARSPLKENEGMLLRPCRGVHTCFMSYAIDVVFIDAGGQVVSLRERLRPWRLSPVVSRACCVLELVAGQVERSQTRVGDQLTFEVRAV